MSRAITTTGTHANDWRSRPADNHVVPSARKTVERASGCECYSDVVDRVLDKGIVIEALLRMRLSGIDLITVDARVIVASIDTYLRSWPALDGAARMSKRSLVSERV